MKRCTKCRRSKPASAFYAHVSKCKSCTKKAVRANYRRNRDHYVAYDKARERTTTRKTAKAVARKLHRLRYPGRYRARMKLGNAVRDGRITRQACSNCGNPHAHAHHRDYRKPLAVEWLCLKCHWMQHGSVHGKAA